MKQKLILREASGDGNSPRRKGAHLLLKRHWPQSKLEFGHSARAGCCKQAHGHRHARLFGHVFSHRPRTASGSCMFVRAVHGTNIGCEDREGMLRSCAPHNWSYQRWACENWKPLATQRHESARSLRVVISLLSADKTIALAARSSSAASPSRTTSWKVRCRNGLKLWERSRSNSTAALRGSSPLQFPRLLRRGCCKKICRKNVPAVPPSRKSRAGSHTLPFHKLPSVFLHKEYARSNKPTSSSDKGTRRNQQAASTARLRTDFARLDVRAASLIKGVDLGARLRWRTLNPKPQTPSGNSEFRPRGFQGFGVHGLRLLKGSWDLVSRPLSRVPQRLQ